MKITQIVRRFGRIGGMEKYVWYLTKGLLDRGVEVSVVCEEAIDLEQLNYPALDVKCVAKSVFRHRWQAMLSFREKVETFLHQSSLNKTSLIHSHERSICHHVTTIHGPLMGPLESLSLIDRTLSRRKKVWCRLEKEELYGPQVRRVYSVSSKMIRHISSSYPGAVLCTKPMWPGVDNLDQNYASRTSLNDPLKVLFVGREWKRKGLPLVYQIVSELRVRLSKHITLHVFGPQRHELPRQIRSASWVQCKGFRSDIPWNEFHLLIHPAKSEPFGMVIAEARSKGLNVLCSRAVGALDLSFTNIIGLALTDELEDWVQSAIKLVSGKLVPQVEWTWSDLCDQMLMEYSEINDLKSRC